MPTETPEVQLKVSAHDQVSSIIVSLLYLVGFAVFLLFMLWLTTRERDTTAQVQVTYLDELAGGDPAFADGRDFEEPSVEDLQDLAVSEMTEVMTALTDVASTVEANQEAAGGGATTTGTGERRQAGQGGDASVPRWERWEVRFNTTSLSVYAKQLQSLGIELAAVTSGTDKIEYASSLDRPKPETRSGKASTEKRLYMSYRSGQLKAFDRQLLSRAGIRTQGRLILQLYPASLENQLAGLEMQKAGGRPLKDIRKTVFDLRKAGSGFRFEVIEQRYQ